MKPLHPMPWILAATLMFGVSSAQADTILLSTAGDATLGGITFRDDDLADYDPVTNTAALFFDGSTLFSSITEDIDAVTILPNGNILLSTLGDATLGGITVRDDDLAEYNPVTDTATLFFDGSMLFSSITEDIDAVSILSNGNLILSTLGNATLGGISFGRDDLVEYNLTTNTASLFFDGEALFSSNSEDIDAVSILSNDNLILSTFGNATLGGISFGRDDLVEYNPTTNTASLFFDGDALFSSNTEDINAVSVIESTRVTPIPEPASLLLTGFGFLTLIGYGWKRQKRSDSRP
ncbi:PEP-CTERM sorting domain-containing protein [Pelagibius sp. Alg239-R121]|uniref:PEP-CTERM sorting domain-containing protein n=1 Tax=Pelagibius sp. Alg239-R121 TaxID=2993448 RepID=UPI0024A70FA9|nr:PEP-CTERM sorting domain-containing protein [Pelagibius sp. Alg239-R121]